MSPVLRDRAVVRASVQQPRGETLKKRWEGPTTRWAEKGVRCGSRVALLGLLLVAACTTDKRNGDFVSGNNVGRSLNFQGFANVSGATITLQILNPASQNPYAGGSTWTTLATTVASTTPGYWNDPDPLYAWSLTGVVPVPNSGALPRWPEGGVARFRALQNGDIMYSFNADFPSCLAANASYSWKTIGVTCLSNSSPAIGLVDIDPKPNNGLEFLTLKATAASETAQYYDAIDAGPGESRSTLGGFWSANGFPAGEIVTYYYNAGDLGFGRQMHCRAVTGGRVACYVSNFQTADDAVDNNGLIATVAMETMPGQPNDVRFYVYNSSNNIVPSADLDGFGQKYVPGLCLACHGGTYNPTTNVVTGASFLPFDVYSFQYSISYPEYSLANQENAFQAQNQLLLSTGSDQAVNDLINGWYASTGGIANPAATPNPKYVPSSWSTAPDLYLNVVAPYCRTCHVAQGASKDWDSFAEFSGNAAVPSFVCGAKFMPHARVPYNKFWQSGARAHFINQLGIASACN